MESNYKKLNQRSNTNNTTFRNRFMRTQYDNKEKGNKHIFLKKMLKTKESTGSQKEMNLTEQNYRKVFKNVENLFTNDNAKKKAIKYVIQIGRKKQNDRENNKIEYTNMNLNTTRSKNISNINYIQKRI